MILLFLVLLILFLLAIFLLLLLRLPAQGGLDGVLPT